MKTLPALLIALIGFALPVRAHVGSPDVFVDDHAGPYRLFVTVRVPQVIPGIADIEIRSETNDIREIRVAPMQLTGPGSQLAPVPDIAQRSKTDPQFFTGSLWLMEFGSLQVRIDADGARGHGELSVPVPATAQRTLPMSRFLGILLSSLVVILVFALISIVAAAVREASLEPGAAVTRATARRARVAGIMASFVIIALLLVGGAWWKSEANRYASHIYTPPLIETQLEDGPAAGNGQQAAKLVLREQPAHIAAGNPRRDAEPSNLKDIIPDHNHLMHFFIIRTPAMDSFWHLHPEPGVGADAGAFIVNLPPLPAGHYQLFADVVMRSGFPVTMVGQIDLPNVQANMQGNVQANTQAGKGAEISGTPLAGDDSGIVAHPLAGAGPDTSVSPLEDGGRMIWEREANPIKAPIRANVPLMFRFRVVDGAGKPAADLEPYMGMAVHAEIVRSDGSVFAHVHPSGSAAMAAMELAQASAPGNPQTLKPDEGSGSGMPGMPSMVMPGDHVDPEISFPYGFPNPGRYRIFVQVKRSGKIQTGVFDVTVE